MELQHRLVPIIPCNDLDESQAFYERLGFDSVLLRPEHLHGLHPRGP